MITKTVRYHGYGELSFYDSVDGFVFCHPKTLVGAIDSLPDKYKGVFIDKGGKILKLYRKNRC